MTLLTTGGPIPLELYEVARSASGLKIGVLIANVAIVAYLAAHVRGDRAREERAA